MKKIILRRSNVFLLIVLVYFISQMLGTYIITSSFINYKIDELMPKLLNISNNIYNEPNQISKNTDFILKAYTLEGEEINVFKEETLDSYPINEEALNTKLISYIPKVISDKKLSVLDKIDMQSSESIIMGVPIELNKEVKGVIFLLKPASDFKSVIDGFKVIFTILLLLGTTVVGIFLNMFLNEIKKLEEIRKNYVANVTHELKSPISSIIALTETLADNLVQDPNKKLKYYEIILNESRSLQRMITEMLELSKIQSGKLSFTKQRISGKDLMRKIQDKYSVLFDELGIIFEISENAMNLPDIYSNEERILQVINILLDNARKFVSEQGLIKIEVELHNKYVLMQVIDNGSGIDQSSINRIFDRFNKSDSIINKEGNGLGLSIAKEIIEGLNEKINVYSLEGENTKFSFSIQRV